MKSGIMHIEAHDKGILAERRGRKTTDLRGSRGPYDSGATEVNTQYGSRTTTKRQVWQLTRDQGVTRLQASRYQHAHPGRNT